MLHGVGCDIVHIPRIARLLRLFGNRFLHRAFHASEIAHCRVLQSQHELCKSARDTEPTPSERALLAAESSGGRSGDDGGSDDAAHVRFLAGRWALKEATLKAFGPRILFPEIVLHARSSTSPRPSLRILGRAAALMQAAGIERGLASISHDGEYAVAHVALELGAATAGAHSSYAALELYQAPLVQKPGESAASTL